jgi:hypothetical protein
MMNSIYALSIAALLASASLFAAPMIQFEAKTYDCGTIAEGQAEIVTSVFNVKNIGDAVLKLESVRPSCGCVAVKYDSMIQPGGTALIESFMNTKGFHSGQVTKWIAVSSNAQNDPTVRLTIKAVYHAQIDVLNKYLSFNEARNNKDTLRILTKKADFKILSAKFLSSDNADWQADVPIVISVRLLPSDTVRSDGNSFFSYELVSPRVKQCQGGDVIITTNHPGKPEIRLQATLLK